MHIILSTRNSKKAYQIRTLFAGLPFAILTLDEAGISGKAEESGATLEKNALEKATYAWERTHMWSMADDSGIFIDALGGKPGVRSARWVEKDVTTKGIMLHTLEMLKGVPMKRRGATFKTVAALIAPSGEKKVFKGELRGVILLEPKVPCQPEMPYSAIFMPNGYTQVLAEMPGGEMNEVSHRGQAFRKVRDFLKKQGGS